MTNETADNPYSAPKAEALGEAFTMLDAIKIVISVVIMICLTAFIPFGLIGKLAFLFGTSYAIYNSFKKTKSENNVIECPNCNRVIGRNTPICPRCEQRI